MSAFVLTFATCLTAITQLSPSLWATSIFSNQPIYKDLMNKNKNRKTNSFIFSNKNKDFFACCVFGRKVRLRFPYICTYVNGETGTRYLKNLVCIGDECTCFHIFFHLMLWLLFCVLQNLGRWAKTKCWSDQALAAIYNFLSPKLPNILALFFKPSQYSLEYYFISCLISHVLFINLFIQIF